MQRKKRSSSKNIFKASSDNFGALNLVLFTSYQETGVVRGKEDCVCNGGAPAMLDSEVSFRTSVSKKCPRNAVRVLCALRMMGNNDSVKLKKINKFWSQPRSEFFVSHDTLLGLDGGTC